MGLQDISGLRKKCKKAYDSHKDRIIDILLIGSAAKGKISPSDVDVAAICYGQKEAVAEMLEEALGNDVHLTAYNVAELFHRQEPIWLSMLHEGVSLVTGKKLSSSLFLEPSVMFTYDTSSLKSIVRFFYALKGRDGGKGVLSSTGSTFLAKGVILSPISSDVEMQDFFKRWNVPFTRRRIFMEK